MKFGAQLVAVQIPEWSQAYIDYSNLKRFLKIHKALIKKGLKLKYQKQRMPQDMKDIDLQLYNDIQMYVLLFDELLMGEIDKINAFLQFKLLDCYAKWRDIKINLVLVQKMAKQEFIDNYRDRLKQSFHIFYKELFYTLQYIDINLKGVYKIAKKAKKYRPNPDNIYILSNTEQLAEDSFFSRNKSNIEKLLKEVEQKYINTFYPGPSQKQGQSKLRQITTEKQIPLTTTFLFGLFLGFSIVILIWVLILFIAGTLDPDEAGSSFNVDFPMFRGSLLLITANWLVGLNVYGWNINHVNYKLIFKFGTHYSEIPEILRRAVFQTTIFLILFVWYALILTDDDDFGKAIMWLPKQLCPVLVWLMLFTYYFYPVKDTFNYQGRIYFWKLIIQCFKQPFGKMEFRISWLTDQMISLVGALKDLEYTLCYWIQKFFDNDVGTCSLSTRPTGFILSLIPNYYRAVQCLRNCYDDKKSGTIKSFKQNPQMLNFIKYMLSIITSLLSYLTKFEVLQGINQYWLFMASITTIYSYFWDLKKDWGLLQPGYKGLREILQYNKNFYYFAIGLNLMLRMVWVISISPDMIDSLSEYNITKEIFTFLVYFLEACRRCQWNFFRVENEHVKNFSDLNAVGDLQLPMQLRKNHNSHKQHQEDHEETQKLIEESENGQDQIRNTQRKKTVHKKSDNLSHNNSFSQTPKKNNQNDIMEVASHREIDDFNESINKGTNKQTQKKQTQMLHIQPEANRHIVQTNKYKNEKIYCIDKLQFQPYQQKGIFQNTSYLAKQYFTTILTKQKQKFEEHNDNIKHFQDILLKIQSIESEKKNQKTDKSIEFRISTQEGFQLHFD